MWNVTGWNVECDRVIRVLEDKSIRQWISGKGKD